jgi:hypothetical protein
MLVLDLGPQALRRGRAGPDRPTAYSTHRGQVCIRILSSARPRPVEVSLFGFLLVPDGRCVQKDVTESLSLVWLSGQSDSCGETP